MNLRIAFGFALTALALNTFAQDFSFTPTSPATQIAEESSQRPLGQLIKQQQQRLGDDTVAEESSQRPMGRLIDRQQHRLQDDALAENGSAQTLDRLIKAGQTRQA